MNKKDYISQQAQGLLETITAFGIIIIGVVAVLGLIIAVTSFRIRMKEKIIAVNLAREGIELIRIIRDNNQLGPEENWPFGLKDGIWIVEYNTIELKEDKNKADNSAIDRCENCQLYIDDAEKYLHASASSTLKKTIFKRLIEIKESGLEEKTIISKVFWTIKGRPQLIILETILTGWR